jgi:hypothetical protein
MRLADSVEVALDIIQSALEKEGLGDLQVTMCFHPEDGEPADSIVVETGDAGASIPPILEKTIGGPKMKKVV